MIRLVFNSLRIINRPQTLAFFSTEIENNGTKRPIKCYNCGGAGHMSKECPNEKVCMRCKKPGHTSKECTQPQTCFNCGQPGHMSKDCTSERKMRPRDNSGGQRERKPISCFTCGQSGHISKNCPTKGNNQGHTNPNKLSDL
jgi:cellular nucleic acid-binding protein